MSTLQDELLETWEELEKVRAELNVAKPLADGYLNRLCEAKALLREELQVHDAVLRIVNCKGCKWKTAHRYLPPTHPDWAHEPAHDCWRSRVQTFLED